MSDDVVLNETKIENYRLVDKLGSGGSGKVYRGVYEGSDPSKPEKAAIKIIRTDDTGKLKRSFREALITYEGINSSHLLKIYECGYNYKEEYAVLIMELLEGETLSRKIKKESSFGVGQALNIIQQVVLGLKFLHEKSNVHRDIKPSNIFIENNNNVKLIDYGIIKDLTGQTLTQHNANSILGTPKYMPPEQAQETGITLQTDLYSLGATLYHMLAMCAPYNDISGGIQVIFAICDENRPPRRIAELRPDLPQKIIRLLEKMMAFLPQNRYQSCEELEQEMYSTIEIFSGSWNLASQSIEEYKALSDYLITNLKKIQGLGVIVDVTNFVNFDKIALIKLSDIVTSFHGVLINVPEQYQKMIEKLKLQIKIFSSASKAREYYQCLP